MTYRPAAAAFGPPLRSRVPSLVYLGVALAVGAVVGLSEGAAPGSWLHETVVTESVGRVISARTVAIFLGVGAVASLVASSLRGVQLRGDGVSYRDRVSLFPRARVYRWAQIDRIRFDRADTIALELWDGTTTLLPPVHDRAGLERELKKVAAARAIPAKGGPGLDEVPESTDFV